MLAKIDTSSLEQSFSIFQKMRTESSIQIEAIGEYMRSPGIMFLKRHLLKYGGVEFDQGYLLQLLNDVLKNPVPNSHDNTILRSIKHGYKYADALEPQLKAIDLNDMIHQAVNLASQHLPDNLDEEVQVYFLYGIRGTGIMLGNEIAIDMCDEHISKGGNLDLNNLVMILAHELHHIGVQKYVSIQLQTEGDERTRRLICFLEELLSEGAAYYYLLSPYDTVGRTGGKWKKNLENIAVILAQIQDYIDRILDGSLVDLKETEHLFDESLKGYTAGFVMVEAIDQAFGKEAVLDSIKNCLLFPERYNEAVRKKKFLLERVKVELEG